MRGISIVAMAIALSTTAYLLPGASAGGCSVSDENRTCESTCDADSNIAEVYGTIQSPLLQWRSIEVNALCGGALAATCAGHGECQGKGWGAKGGLTCRVVVTGSVDASAGCVTNTCVDISTSEDRTVEAMLAQASACLLSQRTERRIDIRDDGTAVGTVCVGSKCVSQQPRCERAFEVLSCEL